MKFKFLLPLCFILFVITASDLHYGTKLLTKPLPKDQDSEVRELSWQSTDDFEKYLLDHEDKVSDLFAVDSFYYPNVNFWFMIYTQFDSSQVLMHDREDLSIVYGVLDYTSLKDKGLTTNVLYELQSKISQEKLKDLKERLKNLVKEPFDESYESKPILRALQQAKVVIPESHKLRAELFKKLYQNVRTQTGQRNFIRDGIVRSLPYRKFIHNSFEKMKLPEELFAIPFLESSFNPRAESKAAAAGIWQFMPLIASYYLPGRTSSTDYRFNIALSSLAAAHLLSENLRIMKSWDLAVTAYNSGTKHLLKTKRRLQDPAANLETIIQNSDSEHFGFASKNFYSEFLALVHALAYQEDLFSDLHESDRANVDDELRFFLTKCSLKVSKTLKETELEDVIYHNHHIKKPEESKPRGFILVSKIPLPKSHFFELPMNKVLKLKPKDWERELRNQSCSTR